MDQAPGVFLTESGETRRDQHESQWFDIPLAFPGCIRWEHVLRVSMVILVIEIL